jgi:hydrogenase small subunit
MDEPPGAKMSTRAANLLGTAIKSLRQFTTSTLEKEPKWRRPGPKLSTGYQPGWK